MAAMHILDKVTHICCAGGNPFQKHDDDNDNKQSNATTTTTTTTTSSKPAKITSKPASKNFKATKYENVSWQDMPLNIRKAAEALGFDEHEWDNHGTPPSEHKWWEDLTPEEQAAATTLGWDVTSWDTKYEDKNWADLPDTVRTAAESIGFTAEMWDGDEWPESVDKWWDDMTPKEQEALMVMGYCKNGWDK